MKNVFNGRDLTAQQAERIQTLKQIRRDARVAARSGNPAKREPARRLLASVPYAIVDTLLGGPR